MKLGEFLCSHFNIEDRKKICNIFGVLYDIIIIWCIICYFTKKHKNITEMQKDLCSLWRRCCDWSNMSKAVCKVFWYYWHFGQLILCCGAVLCIGRCLAAPLASTHYKPIAGDSWHTQNIQINKVIGENEKCVFYFLEKSKWTSWQTQ